MLVRQIPWEDFATVAFGLWTHIGRGYRLKQQLGVWRSRRVIEVFLRRLWRSLTYRKRREISQNKSGYWSTTYALRYFKLSGLIKPKIKPLAYLPPQYLLPQPSSSPSHCRPIPEVSFLIETIVCKPGGKQTHQNLPVSPQMSDNNRECSSLANRGTQDLLNHPYTEPFHLPIEIFQCRET